MVKDFVITRVLLLFMFLSFVWREKRFIKVESPVSSAPVIHSMFNALYSRVSIFHPSYFPHL